MVAVATTSDAERQVTPCAVRIGVARLAMALCVWAAALSAQELRVIEPTATVDAQEITRIFSQPPHDSALPQTRSIRKVGSDAGSGGPGVALRLLFAPDSAQIPAAGCRQLDAVALGLRVLPGTPRILVEGHTDAAGTDPYNEALSLRRAQAVRDYLVGRGVSPDWLATRGRGSSALLRPEAPLSVENRRVELRRIP
jgi:outer membrane protein OmpA-like peptidoglycan-associated protein